MAGRVTGLYGLAKWAFPEPGNYKRLLMAARKVDPVSVRNPRFRQVLGFVDMHIAGRRNVSRSDAKLLVDVSAKFVLYGGSDALKSARFATTIFRAVSDVATPRAST